MRAISIFFTVTLILVSCATPPEPMFTTDIHIVSSDQLSQYWVPKKDRIRFSPKPGELPSVSCGYVVLEFLIDSNGNVFSPVIKEAEPEGAWDWEALKSLSLMEFLPAESNPNKTPVKVTRRTDFKIRDEDC